MSKATKFRVFTSLAIVFVSFGEMTTVLFQFENGLRTSEFFLTIMVAIAFILLGLYIIIFTSQAKETSKKWLISNIVAAFATMFGLLGAAILISGVSLPNWLGLALIIIAFIASLGGAVYYTWNTFQESRARR